MIKTEHLTKTYQSGGGTLVALDRVNLHVAKGEFIAITGRSGSGKSTLLYQLGMLDHPTSGTLYIEGVNMARLTSSERTRYRLGELGYVFQDYAVIPSLTALENVMLPLLMQGTTRRAAERTAVHALERIGVGDKLHNLPSQLSGGQQQRVANARAIGHHPKIIFADEPTANLDSETSRVVLDAFLTLHREGQTIVMVTHEKEYAAIADRVIELSDGAMVGDTRRK